MRNRHYKEDYMDISQCIVLARDHPLTAAAAAVVLLAAIYSQRRFFMPVVLLVLLAAGVSYMIFHLSSVGKAYTERMVAKYSESAAVTDTAAPLMHDQP
jgi:hypothetical protein